MGSGKHSEPSIRAFHIFYSRISARSDLDIQQVILSSKLTSQYSGFLSYGHQTLGFIYPGSDEFRWYCDVSVNIDRSEMMLRLCLASRSTVNFTGNPHFSQFHEEVGSHTST